MLVQIVNIAVLLPIVSVILFVCSIGIDVRDTHITNLDVVCSIGIDVRDTHIPVTNLDVKLQLLCLLLVLGQVCFQSCDLVFLVVDRFVERFEFLADPPVAFLFRAELVAATLLGVEFLTTLLTQSQPIISSKTLASCIQCKTSETATKADTNITTLLVTHGVCSNRFQTRHVHVLLVYGCNNLWKS